MPINSFAAYLRSFRSFQGLFSASSTLVPGILYFTSYSPPLFEGASLLTTPIALAIILVGYGYAPRRLTFGGRLHPRVGTAVTTMTIAILLLISYLVLLQICSVQPPAESGRTSRFQTGFWTLDWSLTDDGLDAKQRNPDDTPQDWMLDRSLFKRGGPEHLWKLWTIILAGSLEIVAFLSSFVLWSFAWALLAKHHAETQATKKLGHTPG